eukprot:24983_1
MGVCTSNKNKISENQQFQKARKHLKLVQKASISLANRASICQEVSVIVIGFIRQIVNIHQKKSVKMDFHHLIVRSDIKYLCALYCGSTAPDLVVENGRVLTLQNTHQKRLEYNSILIKKNATLTVPRWNPHKAKGGTLDILCYGNIILEEGASINLNGKGYHGGRYGRNGESYDTRFKSIKSAKNNLGGGGGGELSLHGEYGASTTYGGGGGYGSPPTPYRELGGKKAIKNGHGVGGAVYGDLKLSKLHLGSGGGGGYRFEARDNSLRAEKGGAGGGALKLQCLGSLGLEDGAKICCNGNAGRRGVGGAGSGGSVRIVLNHRDRLQMDGQSHVSAVGGRNESRAGHGGDGRIRMQFLTHNTYEGSSSYCIHDITPKPWMG